MSLSSKFANALIGRRVGAVVVFKEGTAYDDAYSALLNVACVDMADTHVEEFDPESGYPVWYIP